ncbi:MULTISPECIES: neutral zinc metallopeptidase [unclassified Flavobacterium]|uniref:KPN_02809 family neutral zinc metallopeptidase n=1 Tax=unclassified Flavobacterium TaxID=196869 RepID=UPI000F0C1C1C|nr:MULTISPECIES: neutral zinc metallopeptidase [unclassified Flavobacterium]AYN04659.1 metalloprotease [Flavobacterium sp. 140616W15]MCD0474662.1 neutral zinc metallopeptidase [Flavobacterium sp. EDS]
MKWKGTRESDNVEDRRGMSSGGKTIVGGGIIGIIILLVNIFGGENAQFITPVLEQMQGSQSNQTEATAPLSKEDEELGHFVKAVLARNEETWDKIFTENGMTYKYPKLVLFRNSVQTQCGGATSASGPFYCPADQKVYMDLAFFEELKTRFGAKGGDFAIAYVIAHEIGHHIQTLLGTSAKMRKAQEGKSEAQANKLSVALELQADFYAGVWAHYNQQYLEEGDIDEALSAANAVGDDAIQSKMQGQVVPDSFTHGTSEQRMYWFKKGFSTGDIKQGDTFAEIR